MEISTLVVLLTYIIDIILILELDKQQCFVSSHYYKNQLAWYFNYYLEYSKNDNR